MNQTYAWARINWNSTFKGADHSIHPLYFSVLERRQSSVSVLTAVEMFAPKRGMMIIRIQFAFRIISIWKSIKHLCVLQFFAADTNKKHHVRIFYIDYMNFEDDKMDDMNHNIDMKIHNAMNIPNILVIINSISTFFLELNNSCCDLDALIEIFLFVKIMWL